MGTYTARPFFQSEVSDLLLTTKYGNGNLRVGLAGFRVSNHPLKVQPRVACVMYLPHQTLVSLKVIEHSGDPQGGIWPLAYQKIYRGAPGFDRLSQDLRLLESNQRHDDGGTCDIDGRLTKFEVWIGFGERLNSQSPQEAWDKTGEMLQQYPREETLLVAYNLAITATFH